MRVVAPVPRGRLALLREALCVAGMAAALGGVTYLLFRIQPVDDAYITFRCARNLADGFGLTYNRNTPVEASTSLVWTLLMAGATKLGLPLPATACGSGALSAAAALILTYFLAVRCDAPRWAATAAVFAIGATPAYWLSAANGLETGLFACMVAFALLALIDRRRPLLAGALGGLAFLVRPEGGAILPVAAVLSLWLGTRDPAAWRFWRRAAGCWLVILTAATLWRVTTYGSFLPNSVVAKMIPLNRDVLLFARHYFSELARALPHLLWMPLIAVALLPRTAGVWIGLTLLAIQSLVIARNGGDWMPHARLLTPYFPIYAICVATVLARAGTWLCGQRATIAGLTALMVLATIWASIAYATPQRLRATPGLSFEQPAGSYASLARDLRPSLKRDDVLAPEAIGLIGYELPETRIHDFFGLAEPWIARHGWEANIRFGKCDYGYSLAAAPTMFIFHSGVSNIENFDRNTQGAFRRQYATFHAPAHGLVLCIRRDAVERFRTAFVPAGLLAIDPLASPP